MINLEFYKVFLCLSKFLETDFCIGGLRVEISLFKWILIFTDDLFLAELFVSRTKFFLDFDLS